MRMDLSNPKPQIFPRGNVHGDWKTDSSEAGQDCFQNTQCWPKITSEFSQGVFRLILFGDVFTIV